MDASERSELKLLLAACPFLVSHLQSDASPYTAMGDVALLVMGGALTSDQEDAVFSHFNEMAESGDDAALNLLGAGALEMFNDGPEIQALARRKLKGRALRMLEDLRAGWGQPDYSVPG